MRVCGECFLFYRIRYLRSRVQAIHQPAGGVWFLWQTIANQGAILDVDPRLVPARLLALDEEPVTLFLAVINDICHIIFTFLELVDHIRLWIGLLSIGFLESA